MQHSIRIIIADDHPPLREGVAALLNEEPDIEVVATAANGSVAAALAIAHKVDVAVLDIQMDTNQDGIEAAYKIKAERPDTGIVILSQHDYYASALEKMGSGYAYLLKSAPIEKIKEAIIIAHLGAVRIDPQVQRRIDTSSYLMRLTSREKDVLDAMAQGLDHQGIAQLLGVGSAAVSVHKTNIYLKFGIDKGNLQGRNAWVTAVLIYRGLLNLPHE